MSNIFLATFFIGMIVLFVVLAISVTIYALYSIGLYKMAKKLSLPSPWMAFVPIASSYLLGLMAETPSFGKKTLKYSYILLILQAVNFVVSILYSLLTSLYMFHNFGGILILVYLIYFGTIIATNVFNYIALYRLFNIFSPQNAVNFTVLSILFSISTPFIVFSIRNNEPKICYGPADFFHGNGRWSNDLIKSPQGYNPYEPQSNSGFNDQQENVPVESTPVENENTEGTPTVENDDQSNNNEF